MAREHGLMGLDTRRKIKNIIVVTASVSRFHWSVIDLSVTI